MYLRGCDGAGHLRATIDIMRFRHAKRHWGFMMSYAIFVLIGLLMASPSALAADIQFLSGEFNLSKHSANSYFFTGLLDGQPFSISRGDFGLLALSGSGETGAIFGWLGSETSLEYNGQFLVYHSSGSLANVGVGMNFVTTWTGLPIDVEGPATLDIGLSLFVNDSFVGGNFTVPAYGTVHLVPFYSDPCFSLSCYEVLSASVRIVPEPATWPLLVSGLVILCWSRFRLGAWVRR
jgi:hypothetical protein